MKTWRRGTRILSEVTKRDEIGLVDFIAMMAKSSVARASGTALFLTGHPDATPMALLHNIKHNKVLHESNLILNVACVATSTPIQNAALARPAIYRSCQIVG
jgi:KUP system potassium uptake protein